MAIEGTPATPEVTAPLPVTEAAAKPGAVAETKEVKGKGEAPTEKETYSKAEYQAAQETERKRYAGLDSKYTKDKVAWDTERQEVTAARDAALAQIEEAKYNSFLAKVDAEGGDMAAAQQIVARERVIAAKERETKALEGWVKQQQAILNEAGRGKLAYDMLKEHSLEEVHLEKLLSAKDPTEMENLALKLRLEKIKIEQRPPQALDSNRGKRPVGDISKLSPSIALGQLMEDAKSN